MSTATITSKGHVTIPADVRAAFNLDAGDKLLFVTQGDYLLVVPIKRRPISDFYGIFASDTPLPEMSELRRRMHDYYAAKYQQETSE